MSHFTYGQDSSPSPAVRPARPRLPRVMGTAVSMLLLHTTRLQPRSSPHLSRRPLQLLRLRLTRTIEQSVKTPLHVLVEPIASAFAFGKQGTIDLCLSQGEEHRYRKLAKAVSIAETSGCTTGTGLSKNNCHGIMACVGGKCGRRLLRKRGKLQGSRSFGSRSTATISTLQDAQRMPPRKGPNGARPC